MLEIAVSYETFDDETQEFGTEVFFVMKLEHSLASLSKWESKFEKPFLSDKDKTREEILWYIVAMNVGPEIPPEVFPKLSQQNVDDINTYISSKQTATWFGDQPNAKKNTKTITAELIYYWMISLQIPFECENWHLNRLLTLIRVCNEENAPKKKVAPATRAQQQHELNQARRAQMNSRG